MAAYSAGVRTVIIPEDNQRDLDEIDPAVREALEFVPCKNAADVLKIALCPAQITVSKSSNKVDKSSDFDIIASTHIPTDKIKIPAIR